MKRISSGINIYILHGSYKFMKNVQSQDRLFSKLPGFLLVIMILVLLGTWNCIKVQVYDNYVHLILKVFIFSLLIN